VTALPPLPPGAEERAWQVVRRAYEERIATGATARIRTRPRVFLALAPAVLVAAALAVFSPPGRAVLGSLREAVGVEHAAPALFSLPTGGRLLVVSSDGGGTWVVARDGSKRRIGAFDDAVWSPHGLFIAATRRNALLAVDPKGDERWSLARRDVSSPRWSPSGYRVAYLADSGLRVVAGDGTGDRLLDAHPAGGLAWHPQLEHTLAYTSGDAVELRNVDSGRVLWRRAVPAGPELEWSDDGRRLAVTSASLHRVTVLSRTGKHIRTISLLGGLLLGAVFEPRTHRLAVTVRHEQANALDDVRDRRSEIRLVDVDRPGQARLLFAGPGVFGDAVWSPDGRFLLVDWRTANQWLFVSPDGRHVRAVANVAAQFARGDGAVPLLQVAGRWCCAP
jgi:hypothetical protein